MAGDVHHLPLTKGARACMVVCRKKEDDDDEEEAHPLLRRADGGVEQPLAEVPLAHPELILLVEEFIAEPGPVAVPDVPQVGEVGSVGGVGGEVGSVGGVVGDEAQGVLEDGLAEPGHAGATARCSSAPTAPTYLGVLLC